MKVIFASNYHIGSLIIRLFTFSKWSHCGLVFGSSVVHSTGADGVHPTNLEDFKKKYPKHEIIEIDIPNEDAAFDFALNQIGKKYDFTALFGLVMQNRRWHEDDKWFCSELLEATLKAGGRQRFRDSISRIVPQQSWAVL